jgi:PAS domain S-box-containing protein
LQQSIILPIPDSRVNVTYRCFQVARSTVKRGSTRAVAVLAQLQRRLSVVVSVAALMPLLVLGAAYANLPRYALIWISAASCLVVAGSMALVVRSRRLSTGDPRALSPLQPRALDAKFADELFEATQSAAHVGTWDWTPATGLVRWSAEFCRILGLPTSYRQSDVAAFLSCVHPDDVEEVKRLHAEAASSAHAVQSEFRIVRPDGTVRHIRSRMLASRDQSSGTSRLLGTLQDVSELRAAQQLKDAFISTVSHELRTPLAAIRGALGLLAGGAVGELSRQGQRMVDVATMNCDRLVRIINDILDVQSLAKGLLGLNSAPHTARELLVAAVEQMRCKAARAGVSLALAEASGTVLADRDRITHALTNLIDNAVKFSPPGGTVSVAATTHDGTVQFMVRDEGPGIPADQVAAIFAPFHQVESSDDRSHGGAGLGLTVCRGIVASHGGRVWADSAVGKGSTFYFTLPASLQKTEAVPVPFPIPVKPVLVCDDDRDFLEVLSAVLKSHGFETLEAHNGTDAIALAQDHQPSVILLDLVMPGLSGLDTLAALKAEPTTAGIPVIILSAVIPDHPPDGMMEWLVKPVDDAALFDSLHRAIMVTDSELR